MKALDANIVLRLILGDDERQAEQAERLIRDRCWVSLTVLVEIAWVLESRYGFDRATVSQLLRGVASYDTVDIEAHDAVMWCIDRYQSGGDIADLIHLAAAREMTAFATFDRSIVSVAGASPPVAIQTLG